MKNCESECALYQQFREVELKQEEHGLKILGMETHMKYTKEAVEKLEKLPREFYTFRADIQAQIRTWGIVMTGSIALVGIFLKVLK